MLAGRKFLDEFMRHHADARKPLQAWLDEIKKSTWHGPQDIKARHASASFLADNQVVFNIKGNRYRLMVLVDYVTQSIAVQRIGTHEEYDRW